MKKQLSETEKNFCRLYATLADPEKSALLAGYSAPERKWPALMMREDILREITRIAKDQRELLTALAASGLRQLAFGDISDAMTLVWADSLSREEIGRMNLFNVAEVKRTKDKSVELKFFDRIKALEKLATLQANENEPASESILDAINASAQALRSAHRADESDAV